MLLPRKHSLTSAGRVGWEAVFVTTHQRSTLLAGGYGGGAQPTVYLLRVRDAEVRCSSRSSIFSAVIQTMFIQQLAYFSVYVQTIKHFLLDNSSLGTIRYGD